MITPGNGYMAGRARVQDPPNAPERRPSAARTRPSAARAPEYRQILDGNAISYPTWPSEIDA